MRRVTKEDDDGDNDDVFSMLGLVLFATYEGCDPLAAGLIDKKDQIVPFYVMDRLSSVPGLPGLFVACIFSGALR